VGSLGPGGGVSFRNEVCGRSTNDSVVGRGGGGVIVTVAILSGERVGWKKVP